MSISIIQAITIDEMLKKQEAQIASLTEENEQLRRHIQNMLAILDTAYALPDNYKQGLEELRQIGSARATLQPKEGNP